MWLTIIILFMLWLASATILNLIRIFDAIESRQFTKRLTKNTEELIKAYDYSTCCEPVGKHAKED